MSPGPAIRAEASEAGISIVGDVAAGAVAYLDAEWLLPGRSGEVPALVLTPDGQMSFGDTDGRPVPGDVSAERLAGVVFTAVAREAAAAVAGGDVPVEVTGDGIFARRVRSIVGSAPAGAGGATTSERPAAVVDTTGDPEVILAATQRLADFGVLALVGEPLDRPLDLDLYADVHRRGLRVVGVAPPLTDPVDTGDESLAHALDPDPVVVVAGAPLPPGAAWYRIDF